MGRLAGKVAVITGAARGMGASHAQRFVAEGAKVVLTDTGNADGEALASELGPDAMFLHHDVRSAEEWTRVIDTAVRKFGPVTVLVNNAGIAGPLRKTADMTEPEFLNVCAVNQTAVFLGMKAVIPSMLAAGGGSIVNVSSLAGIVASYGFPSLAYVASKFAVRGMSKATAIEYAPAGIRVNSVHPGFILTPMMVEATDEQGGAAASMIPLGRIGQPNEVTNMVLFLASDEASFVTGQEHIVDGGMVAQ